MVLLWIIANSSPKVGDVGNGGRGDHLSFSFGSLDLDLAALLSPNGVDGKDKTIFVIKPSLAPSSTI
jgi:hypothetical protein